MTQTEQGLTLADWLQRMESVHPQEIELGLERVAQVARQAGLAGPEQPIITVAGTNGKGSVCTFLTSIYTAAGYAVGTYTSPHLVRFNERIALNGVPVEDVRIVAALEHIEAHRGDISLTYFEYATLAAMQVFASANVDVIVLEVGLGGRLDAVNIWDADVAVVTSISVDHASWLGRSREQIAPEKVAVSRAGRPLVSGERNPPLSLRQSASAIGANLLMIGEQFDWRGERDQWRYMGEQLTLDGLPSPGLQGQWQLDNATVAITVTQQLSSRLTVGSGALSQGIAGAHLAGRLQQKHWQGQELLLDVAHNPDAAQRVAAYIKESGWQGLTAIFGVMQDKDIEGVVEPLLPLIAHWVLFEPSIARAMPIDELAQRLTGLTGARLEKAAGARDALDKAVDANTSSTPVLVFGSFYTLAPILETTG